jgi:hypothetical protein
LAPIHPPVVAFSGASTRKVHQVEEVDMLTTKIDLLMKKLENLGLNHLKMVDAHVTCEECEETGHMGINCTMVSWDVSQLCC